MQVRLNGELREIPDGLTVSGLLAHLGVKAQRVAVEVNEVVVTKDRHDAHGIRPGDAIEIVAFVGGGTAVPQPRDTWTLGKHTFSSRLLVGTGKYPDFPTMKRALEASGAEVVTVAVRRLDLSAKGDASLLGWIPKHMTLLPNTAACYTADEAIRTSRLGRELGMGDLVKLEVIGDKQTLFPDVEELVKAARVLVKEGFVVMPYTNDDPVTARKLEDACCAAVMPLGAPIGSGLGLRNPYNLRIILETAKVPVLVDAGVGTASDAAIAMELGAVAVLMNTAIAGARDPVMMAEAMRDGVAAGRKAFLAGRIPMKLHAAASSPLTGLIGG
jgi:thiazole synthase